MGPFLVGREQSCLMRMVKLSLLMREQVLHVSPRLLSLHPLYHSLPSPNLTLHASFFIFLLHVLCPIHPPSKIWTLILFSSSFSTPELSPYLPHCTAYSGLPLQCCPLLPGACRRGNAAILKKCSLVLLKIETH